MVSCGRTGKKLSIYVAGKALLRTNRKTLCQIYDISDILSLLTGSYSNNHNHHY